MNSTTTPATDVYKNATDIIAAMLPAELRAQCDRLLGDNAESKDKWAVYQTTLSHWQHTQGAK